MQVFFLILIIQIKKINDLSMLFLYNAIQIFTLLLLYEF